jgi:hypothetical protein
VGVGVGTPVALSSGHSKRPRRPERASRLLHGLLGREREEEEEEEEEETMKSEVMGMAMGGSARYWTCYLPKFSLARPKTLRC